MPFVNNLNFVIFDGQFEHRDSTVTHKLRRNGTTNKRGKFLTATSYVLLSLHDAVFIVSTFCLNRDHELAPVPVDSNINFINFNLSNIFDSRSQVILQRICRYA